MLRVPLQAATISYLCVELQGFLIVVRSDQLVELLEQMLMALWDSVDACGPGPAQLRVAAQALHTLQGLLQLR